MKTCIACLLMASLLTIPALSRAADTDNTRADNSELAVRLHFSVVLAQYDTPGTGSKLVEELEDKQLAALIYETAGWNSDTDKLFYFLHIDCGYSESRATQTLDSIDAQRFPHAYIDVDVSQPYLDEVNGVPQLQYSEQRDYLLPETYKSLPINCIYNVYASAEDSFNSNVTSLIDATLRLQKEKVAFELIAAPWGGYWLRTGSFSNKSDAYNQVQELRQLGFIEAFVCATIDNKQDSRFTFKQWCVANRYADLLAKYDRRFSGDLQKAANYLRKNELGSREPESGYMVTAGLGSDDFDAMQELCAQLIDLGYDARVAKGEYSDYAVWIGVFAFRSEAEAYSDSASQDLLNHSIYSVGVMSKDLNHELISEHKWYKFSDDDDQH